jgi:hypothetical protein
MIDDEALWEVEGVGGGESTEQPWRRCLLRDLVSWGGGEAYSSTSTSSPGHGSFGGGSSIPLHTKRGSSLSPSAPGMTPRSHHGRWRVCGVGPADRWRSLFSLSYRSSVFFHAPVFPIVVRLIRGSSLSGPSHFVANREVGLRPLPTVGSCRPIVGMSRLDGVGEGAQMDVLPIAPYPGLPLPVTEPNHSPVPVGIRAPRWGVALRSSGRGSARSIWEEGTPRLTGGA